jgi:hypothetical protein
MIQLMIVDLEEANVHYDGDSFPKYLSDVTNAVNKRLSTLRNLSIQGVSMNVWNGEIKSIVVMYFSAKFRKYSPNAPEPYPQIYISSLDGVPNLESHINSMLVAFQNNGRYVNYVKVFNENGSMPGYCSIIHSPMSEGGYAERP